MNDPLVSILMTARNAAPFIDAALRSACEQTFRNLEVVVVDDGSTDGTGAIAHSHASRDSRVRVLDGPRRGLSAVRNVSLDAARGRYAVVLDSDDILHPAHVEGLVNVRMATAVSLVAANMLEFRQDVPTPDVRPFAHGAQWQSARDIGVEEYVLRGQIGARAPSLGYLKPLFDMEFLRSRSLRYDERLRIGEDFDLVMRALLAGGRLRYLPQATYFYRKHAASTSHRLTRTDLEALLAAARTYASDRPARDAAFAARCRNLRDAIDHVDVIAALKQGHWVSALRRMVSNPHVFRLTATSVSEAAVKRLVPRAPGGEAVPDGSLRERLLSVSAALDQAIATRMPPAIPNGG